MEETHHQSMIALCEKAAGLGTKSPLHISIYEILLITFAENRNLFFSVWETDYDYEEVSTREILDYF